jgi:bifunctional non-homologous end joining protein LigD
MIRQARSKDCGKDKAAKEVVDETAGGTDAFCEEADDRGPSPFRENRPGPNAVMGVTLTNANKALWPESAQGAPVTKIDLARYYEAVGEWMLPHLRGRPCSLLRAPDGITGQQFFQRHADGRHFRPLHPRSR